MIGLVKFNPEIFHLAILVAKVGNNLGGKISRRMGRGMHHAMHEWRAATTSACAMAV